MSTVDTLRLLGGGASGAILMALGDGPLRTKDLTKRVPGYAPRTIYRYAGKLAALGVIDRHEEPGVPSKVVHSLSDPCGRELHELVEAYAAASMLRLPSGDIGSHGWGSLALLADLWESGMVDELNRGPRSPTELSRKSPGLSFHQVSRRASLFEIGGLLKETSLPGRRRRQYELTDKARRGMALVAGIGRWRRRHVVPKGMTGLTTGEVGSLMRAVLPLVALPDHAGKSFEMRVAPGGENGENGEVDALVWADVGSDGTVLSSATPREVPDGAAHGKVTAWVDSVLDGSHHGLKVNGDALLITECLRRLHATLWNRRDKKPPTPP